MTPAHCVFCDCEFASIIGLADHVSRKHRYEIQRPKTNMVTLSLPKRRAELAQNELRFALKEIAQYLSPENENVKRGDLVAAIRDLAQINLSLKGLLEESEQK